MRRRQLLCLIPILVLSSCDTELLKQKDKIIDSLQSSNFQLKSDLENYKQINSNQLKAIDYYKQFEPKFAKKFAFVIIKYSRKVIETSPNSNDLIPVTKHYINWTNIQEVEDYNEDLKYRLIDHAESSLRENFSNFNKDDIIESKECYVFNSYSEASKNLNRLKNE
jgi:hypothetical protein